MELCVTSVSPGIKEMFTINITTDSIESTVFFYIQTVLFKDPLQTDSTIFLQDNYSLHFDVTNAHPQSECYNVSVDFDANNICGYFNFCEIKIVSTLKVDENARVDLNRSMASVIIKPPLSKCDECNQPPTSNDTTSPSSPSTSNDGVITAAIIPSLLVVIAIVGIVVIIIFYWNKTEKLRQTQLLE